ncbi:2-oxo acid dehydrogenase subunit E2 [Dactylosporangium sp. CA-139066]|uniref:2-oxo acid dehydrogenase subunit E2 n=1 Tax=Dactylosporangium sp. CA-139066 TaxID=3239930 RepID=UPI003D924438
MREIRLPKLNTNDVTYTLLQWYGADGDTIAEGAVLALVETSKTAEDLLAPAGGVLQRVAAVKDECAPGDIIGYLLDSEAERVTVSAAPEEPVPVITEPARLLIEELGLDPALVRGLGKAIVKRSDIEALSAGPRRYELPRQQRAVADVVTRSHASIPAAFTAMWIEGAACARVRRELGGASLTALVVKAIGTLRERHPLCFGSYVDDGAVVVADGAHVAVTVDAGRGLYLPVVRDVAALSLAQVGAALAAMPAAARAGTFRAGDLAGANIGLSVTDYADVVLTQPIIPPGTACMFSLGGSPRAARFTLGLAHDHRIVNGRDAVIVLRAMKRVLESGAGLTG